MRKIAKFDEYSQNNMLAKYYAKKTKLFLCYVLNFLSFVTKWKPTMTEGQRHYISLTDNAKFSVANLNNDTRQKATFIYRSTTDSPLADYMDNVFSYF